MRGGAQLSSGVLKASLRCFFPEWLVYWIPSFSSRLLTNRPGTSFRATPSACFARHSTKPVEKS